jgi:hypothetical protein
MSTNLTPSITRPNRYVYSPFLDFNLIVFPVLPGLIYLIYSSLVSSDLSLFNFVLFVFLGESHFAASVFFFRSESFQYIKQRMTSFVLIPIALVAFYVVIGFVSLKIAIWIGAAASAYHVTKQSIGVFRLYNKKPNKESEKLIWGTSFLFVTIGFFRFFSPLNIFNNLHNKTSLFILASTLVFLLTKIFYTDRNSSINSYSKLSLLMGCLIYSPYSFVDDPLKAALIGVSCHWLQYLSLTWAVYIRQGSSQNRRVSYMSILIFLLVALLLSLGEKEKIMTGQASLILLLPLSIQLLHYYYDSFIWKKSDPHINQTVFSRIYK